MKHKLFLILLAGAAMGSCIEDKQPEYAPHRDPAANIIDREDPQEQEPDIILSDWNLVWSDEFDYPDARLDERWISQNGPSNHILCSRWRENAVVADGVLRLVNKKESRGGQDWTSGNIWTKERFTYGYYECRYKYSATTGTNNSFWLMTNTTPTLGKSFEIDINEGHFPSEMNTNIHDRSVNPPITNSKTIYIGIAPDYSIQLENPVKAQKVRFSSKNEAKFHIKEFRIYNVSPLGYPAVLSPTADSDVAGLVNYAKTSDITVSGTFDIHTSDRLVDGSIDNGWVSQDNTSAKWIEFDLKGEKTLGCIQFINGWKSGGEWKDILQDYKVEYFDGTAWKEIASVNAMSDKNLASEYDTYGLEWTETELIFYCDRREVRRVPNDFCKSETPIWLSLAIVTWAGPVTDAIDGTFMEVDYVRVYKRK